MGIKHETRAFIRKQELLFFNSIQFTNRTSVKVRSVLLGIDGYVNGRAVPAHVSEGLLACFLDLASSLDNGLHELQVAAAQLSLGGHHALKQLTVLRLVDV